MIERVLVSPEIMESNAIISQFGAGYDMGVYLVTSEILSRAWEESEKAYRCDQEQFTVLPIKEQDLVFIAFPGTSNSEDVITDSKFGVCSINEKNEYFKRIASVEAASVPSVHSGFLARFLRILQTSNIAKQVGEARDQKKTIVFTGHSLGGALATLATLWVLEERKDLNHPPFCVTFGCPLVGDEKLGRAIRGQRWAGHFCHVVSRHDIVPRILLAPFKSVFRPLKALLPYWTRSMQNKGKISDDKVPLSEKEIGELFTTVRKHALAVASTIRATSLVATNLLSGSIRNVVQQSPYRPFGYFVFCSRSGAACIETYTTVLQMLYYTLQSPDKCPDLTKDACIAEHSDYRTTIDEVAEELLNPGGGARLAISDAKSTYEVGIAMQLEALGLGVANVQARLALQAGGEAESRKNINSARKAGELGNAQAAMGKIEWYKKCCAANGLGYYDSFKQHEQEKDLEANLARIKLAAFWDEVIEMVDIQELPDDFEWQNKWVNAGTAYRRLVEPLDIANYYRLGKHDDTGGHYVYKGRPRRYKILEKWLKQKEKTRSGSIVRRKRPASLTTDSLFWGYLEELLEIEEQLPSSENAMSKRQAFQHRVNELVSKNELSNDVVLENSSFMKWWKESPLEIDLSPLLSYQTAKPR